jgi:AraC-like DNA-binding protein
MGVLYVLRVASATQPVEHVRAWQPSLPGVREVFHARFVEHRYPPHTHDTWTVVIVDRGSIRYGVDRFEHGAGLGSVTVLPPHVTHDGRAGNPDVGFRKRVLYLDEGLLSRELIGHAVDHPRHDDPGLHRTLARVHDALQAGDDLLAGEGGLAVAVERLVQRLSPNQAGPPHPHDLGLADRLRQFLDAHCFEPVTLAAAARALQGSTTHLVRSFSRAFGVSPHAYVVGRRIDEARHRLLEGEPPALVAAIVGFHDQAHLTRHFRRHVGTTPGRYARGLVPRQ